MHAVKVVGARWGEKNYYYYIFISTTIKKENEHASRKSLRKQTRSDHFWSKSRLLHLLSYFHAAIWNSQPAETFRALTICAGSWFPQLRVC